MSSIVKHRQEVRVTIKFRGVQEVADELGVDVQTVRRWIHAGKLRAFKPGKEYRVRETDLEEFLRAREVVPKATHRSPYEPTLYNALADEERREPTPEELNAIRVVEDDCNKLEELLDRVDLTAEHNEPLVRLLDNHVKVVAATTLPLIKQEALRPLLLPGAARLVELAGRIRMAEDTRNIINEVEQAAHNAS